MTNAMWNVFWGSLGRRYEAPAPAIPSAEELAARRRALAATTPLRRVRPGPAGAPSMATPLDADPTPT